MYAVIHTGGKQYRVAEGDQVTVELCHDPEPTFDAVLLVDGDRVLATPAELSGVAVKGRVLGETKGPKITGFTYKNKTNSRKSWGHRQRYSTVEIVSIEKG